jgi:Uncharacterized conserved protein (DUF2358)
MPIAFVAATCDVLSTRACRQPHVPQRLSKRSTSATCSAQRPPDVPATVVAGRERVLRVLAVDLPRQYEAPLELDYSIYANGVRFTDPMTKIKSLVLYRGMIATIGLLAVALFQPGSVEFRLDECALEDGVGLGRVRTVFRTVGRTRWAADSAPLFEIAGVDSFWLVSDGENVVVEHHESKWEQTPAEVSAAFFRRK